jgi:hypothetical protein
MGVGRIVTGSDSHAVPEDGVGKIHLLTMVMVAGRSI